MQQTAIKLTLYSARIRRQTRTYPQVGVSTLYALTHHPVQMLVDQRRGGMCPSDRRKVPKCPETVELVRRTR